MRAIEELLCEPPRAKMLPQFVLQRAEALAGDLWRQRKESPDRPAADIRRAIINALGLERIPQSSQVTMVDRLEADDFVIEKIVYEATPGLPVPALLYIPNRPGPHPAVVHPPGHWMEDAKLADPIQRMNLHLVRNGVATLSYDTLGQGERRVGWHQHGQLAPHLVGFTSLGLMVRDSLAALDLLEVRGDIDADRLGIVGASGGGFSSIFASVIDERIKVAAISSIVNTHFSQIRDAAFGTGWDSWVDVCNQVPELCALGTMGEVLACVAPRSLLVANAMDDPPFPLEGAREVAREVGEILDRDGRSNSFTYREVPGGHGFASQAMRESVAEFLTLALTEQSPSVEETGVPTFAPRWPIPHNQASASHPQVFRAASSSGTCLAEPTDSNAPIVAIAQERACQLRGLRKPLDRCSLQALLGPFPDSERGRAIVSNHVALEQGSAQRLKIDIEAGITLDAIFLLPDNWTDDLPPVLVVLDEGGKQQSLKSNVVEHARRRGWAVLLPDLRGTGESAASEFEVATAAWMLDRDLLNQRVWDVLQVVEFLSDRYSSAQQIDKGRIALVGFDDFALVGLLAAAIDQRVFSIATSGPSSLEEYLVRDASASPMVFRFNLLEALDLRDLCALISPRSARIGVPANDLIEVLGMQTDDPTAPRR